MGFSSSPIYLVLSFYFYIYLVLSFLYFCISANAIIYLVLSFLPVFLQMPAFCRHLLDSGHKTGKSSLRRHQSLALLLKWLLEGGFRSETSLKDLLVPSGKLWLGLAGWSVVDWLDPENPKVFLSSKTGGPQSPTDNLATVDQKGSWSFHNANV